MPEHARTYHIAAPGQDGAYPDQLTLDAALLAAFDIARTADVPVTVLCAEGPLEEGARITWEPLCVISPPKAPEEATT